MPYFGGSQGRVVFSMGEIRRVVFECDKNRSPGPDEFSFGLVRRIGKV